MKIKNFELIGLWIIAFLAATFSVNEFRKFLSDNRGGLVLSFGDIDFPDMGWLEYKLLKVDKSVKSINPQDLPEDFCPEACKLVDEFHRKTVNQDIEWMLYFDYTNGDVIYSWKGDEDKTGGEYDKIHFKNRKIASLHNHPKNYYSFPSSDNFDILCNEFEDYEIITSIDVFWVVEFKGRVEKEIRQNFQYHLAKDMNIINNKIKSRYINAKTINSNVELYIGDYLLNVIDKKINEINLVLNKKEIQ
ncbi:MAG: hypothetical protein IJ258_00370 [Methanobrevibacter sp.]|uniref:hypothetical protein n=1 Tax=Methanobrevibacter sp. TaxID=66852 RepID=UPI0025DC62CE|nr:hypothetical protein [Methanobrevibacter sp.]MBQ8016538.1 hypothetical protein [Methanobrevibacter sp.]